MPHLETDLRPQDSAHPPVLCPLPTPLPTGRSTQNNSQWLSHHPPESKIHGYQQTLLQLLWLSPTLIFFSTKFTPNKITKETEKSELPNFSWLPVPWEAWTQPDVILSLKSFSYGMYMGGKLHLGTSLPKCPHGLPCRSHLKSWNQRVWFFKRPLIPRSRTHD